jgi:hypothetical protein
MDAIAARSLDDKAFESLAGSHEPCAAAIDVLSRHGAARPVQFREKNIRLYANKQATFIADNSD